MNTLRLSVHDKYIRDRRWDILGRGFQKLEEAFGENLSVDLTSFEPFHSMKNEKNKSRVPNVVLEWMDKLSAIAKENNAKYHIFSVDVENKTILHSVTSDIEKVESADVDMT